MQRLEMLDSVRRQRTDVGQGEKGRREVFRLYIHCGYKTNILLPKRGPDRGHTRMNRGLEAPGVITAHARGGMSTRPIQIIRKLGLGHERPRRAFARRLKHLGTAVKCAPPFAGGFCPSAGQLASHWEKS